MANRERQLAIVASLLILFAIPVTIVATLKTRTSSTKAAACYDADGDGAVSAADSTFLQTQITKGIYTKSNDLNNDGLLNGSDQDVLKTHFGETCAPTVSFFVDPGAAKRGDSVTLTWSIDHANSVNIEGLGIVAKEGKKILVADSAKTYKLTATGAGGSVVATSELKIIP